MAVHPFAKGLVASDSPVAPAVSWEEREELQREIHREDFHVSGLDLGHTGRPTVFPKNVVWQTTNTLG